MPYNSHPKLCEDQWPNTALSVAWQYERKSVRRYIRDQDERQTESANLSLTNENVEKKKYLNKIICLVFSAVLKTTGYNYYTRNDVQSRIRAQCELDETV